jgi:uncharacterized protein YhfF
MAWQLELATPGPLRDRLVAAVRDGSKTASTLIGPQLPPDDTERPRVGGHYRVIDSAGGPAAEIVLDAIDAVRLGDVTMDHVRADTPRLQTVTGWREAHVAGWAALDPATSYDDDSIVHLLRFHLA